MSRITTPRLLLAAAAGLLGLFAGDQALLLRSDTLVTPAHAVVGRPVTPMSYAGVARRTTRRATVATGAAAAAGAAAVAPRAGCLQVTDAYGRLIWRCP